MVYFVPDRSGRFSLRPHFAARELDQECEGIVFSFMREKYGEVKFPILTEDLTRLIERESEDLDLYADLTEYGPDVEGLTVWFEQGPHVKISELLANDQYRQNRLRTTLTHEYGHVHFHTPLWRLEAPQFDLFKGSSNAKKQFCKRHEISVAAETDWMEWQAGYACGALLMPASHVRSLVAPYTEQHGQYGPVSHASVEGAALISLLQSTYRVSAEAAKVRLFRLNVFGEPNRESSLFNL